MLFLPYRPPFFKPMLLAFSVVVGGLFSSCGSNSNPPGTIDPATTRCNRDVAEISVGDGFLQILCGCTGASEANGKVFPAPGNLTCHLQTSKSQVFFYFSGTTLRHQIVPVGSKKFAASPVNDPSSDSSPAKYSYAVSFPEASSQYFFQDSYSGMSGQIFVP